MSCVLSVRGSAVNSAQLSRSGSSTSPKTVKSRRHEIGLRDVAGVEDRPLVR